jgi:hypothetical protein
MAAEAESTPREYVLWADVHTALALVLVLSEARIAAARSSSSSSCSTAFESLWCVNPGETRRLPLGCHCNSGASIEGVSKRETLARSLAHLMRYSSTSMQACDADIHSAKSARICTVFHFSFATSMSAMFLRISVLSTATLLATNSARACHEFR